MDKFISRNDKKKLINLFGEDQGTFYSNFFEGINRAGIFYNDELKAILQSVIKTEPLNSNIVNQLRNKAKSDSEISPKVLKGRDILRNYLIDYGYKTTLDQSGVTVILGGSLEFNDPKNYDVDWIAIGLQRTQVAALTTDEILDMSDDIERVWAEEEMPVPPKYINEVHMLNSLFLEDWRDVSGALTLKPEFDSYDNKFYYLSHLGFALTGIPLYNEEREQFEIIQSETERIVSTEPLVRAFVNESIASSLQNRLNK